MPLIMNCTLWVNVYTSSVLIDLIEFRVQGEEQRDVFYVPEYRLGFPIPSWFVGKGPHCSLFLGYWRVKMPSFHQILMGSDQQVTQLTRDMESESAAKCLLFYIDSVRREKMKLILIITYCYFWVTDWKKPTKRLKHLKIAKKKERKRLVKVKQMPFSHLGLLGIHLPAGEMILVLTSCLSFALSTSGEKKKQQPQQVSVCPFDFVWSIFLTLLCR